MGGNVDWSGIGQSIGHTGRTLVEHKERTLERREREATRTTQQKRIEQADQEQKRRKALEEADSALTAVQGLPDEDDQKQEVIGRYRTAYRDFYGVDPPLRQRVIEPPKPAAPAPAPAQAPVQRVPGPEGRAEGQDVTAPAQPVPAAEPAPAAQPAASRTIWTLPGSEKDIDPTQLTNTVRGWTTTIDNATTPGARAAGVRGAQAWRAAILARYPKLEDQIPDFERHAREGEEIIRNERAAEAAAKGRASWVADVKTARAATATAMRGDNAESLLAAIAEQNALMRAGREHAYIGEGQQVDPVTILRRWASQLKPERFAQIASYLEQFGIRPTPDQKKYMELYEKTKRKAAAPRAGGKKRPIIEEMK